MDAPGSFPGKLSAKQREVLDLVAQGHTSKEIAARLRISESAVNQRIEAIRHRMGGLPRAEIARRWRQTGGDEDPETCNPLTGKIIEVPPAIPLGDGPEREGLVVPRSGASGAAYESPGSGPEVPPGSQPSHPQPYASGEPDAINLLNGPHALWWRLLAIVLIAAMTLSMVEIIAVVIREFTWIGAIPKKISVSLPEQPHALEIKKIVSFRRKFGISTFILSTIAVQIVFIYSFFKSQTIEKIVILVFVLNFALAVPTAWIINLSGMHIHRYLSQPEIGDILPDLIPSLILAILSLRANRLYLTLFVGLDLNNFVMQSTMLLLHQVDWLPDLINTSIFGTMSNMILIWGVWSNRRRAIREGPFPNWLSEVRQQQGHTA